jgi:hypothetical protein
MGSLVVLFLLLCVVPEHASARKDPSHVTAERPDRQGEEKDKEGDQKPAMRGHAFFLSGG